MEKASSDTTDFSDKEKAQIEFLDKKGISYSQIAKSLKCTEGEVLTYLYNKKVGPPLKVTTYANPDQFWSQSKDPPKKVEEKQQDPEPVKKEEPRSVSKDEEKIQLCFTCGKTGKYLPS